MDTTQCITDGQWERYAENALSGAEMLSVQQHVESCEICADIKEGIDSMANPAGLREKVELINAEVDEYLKPKKQRGIIWIYWSAAAVFLTGIGLSWWMAGRQNDAVAIHQTVAATGKKDTGFIIFPDITEETPGAQPQKEEAVAQAKKKTGGETPGSQPVEDIAAGKGEQAAKTLNEKDLDKKATYAAADDKGAFAYRTDAANDSDRLARIETEEKVAITDNIQAETVKDAAKTKKYKRETLPAAVFNNNLSNNSYNNNAYDFSNNAFIDYSVNDSLQYYSALKYFDLKQYDRCLMHLESIYGTQSDYYENGLLLMAQTLLAQDKKEEAKAVLKTVISLGRKKSKEAGDLLKSIK